MTALLKASVNSSKKKKKKNDQWYIETWWSGHTHTKPAFHRDLYFRADFLAKILNLLVIIPFLTNSVNPPPLLSLFLRFLIS